MGSTAGWAGLYVPDEGDNAGADIYGEAIAAALRPKVVPTYASTAARDAAAAPLIAATPTVRMLAIVDGIGLSRYLGPKVGGGQDWEWVGNVTPVEYTFATGVSPIFNVGSTFANYTTMTYNFTPSRTGWADINLGFDLIRVNPGWGAAYARLRFSPGGGAPLVGLGDFPLAFDSSARETDYIRVPARQRLIAGQGATLALDVSSFNPTPGVNQWQFGSCGWHVVQQ